MNPILPTLINKSAVGEDPQQTSLHRGNLTRAVHMIASSAGLSSDRRFGGLEVHDKLKLSWRLYRQVTRLGSNSRMRR
jgi:hypothetical protein